MKKLLLLIVLLAYSTSMFSQLFVRPNPTSSTDSYVYVNDEILFVEQDVNLEKNGAGATLGSLYLRNGAQLIQGSTVAPTGSTNQGNGQLSVYQNAPDSDQWTYNYWCSPTNVPYPSPGNNGFKAFYLIQDIQNTTESTSSAFTSDWNGSSIPLTISRKWIYTKPRGWEAETDYVYQGEWGLVPTGMGYTMKGVDAIPVAGTGFEYDFRGRPNNGDINITVYNDELTLSGNPYPSALDLNRVFYDTTTGDANGTSNSGNNEINEFYYWDEDKDTNSHYYSENEGGYGTFVPGNSNPDGYNGDGQTGSDSFQPGTYVPPTFKIWNSGGGSTTGSGGSGSPYERRFAPIGQGVLFYAGANGTVTLKNAHRRYILEGDNSDFRSSGDGSVTGTDPDDPDPDPINNESPLLRINTYFGASHIRQMALAFSDHSSDGFDRGQDGRHPMDAVGAEIYFPIEYNGEKTPFVIQTVPFNIQKRIPVTIKLNSFQEVVVKAIEEVNFNEEAYLIDRLQGTYKQITNGYKAVMVLDAGEYKDRFYIVFQNRRESNENSEGTIEKEETRANVDFFQNNPSKQLEILNPEGYDIKSALVYDMAGKLVINKSNLGNQNNISLSTSNVADGIYLVQLTTSENINIDYKMVIKNN